MRERAASLLGEVGLGGKLHRSTGHLSGGEQQRVAVARALANSPGIILADEPTGNLDAANSQVVFDLLARVAHDMHQAVLIVSHNTELAERCDRVLRMRDGLFVDEH
jgi:lipoprotein-releasing system ATP-binding protein